MTAQQDITIKEQRSQFLNNCSMYNGYDTDGCSFHIYTNFEDKNVTLQITTIDGVDNFQPFFKTVYLLVQPDGKLVNLLDFYSMDEVLTFMSNQNKLI